jgi:hypothetical protein
MVMTTTMNTIKSLATTTMNITKVQQRGKNLDKKQQKK